jgi:hypothetical protein
MTFIFFPGIIFPSWTEMKKLNAIVAILAYALALGYMWYGINANIEASYELSHTSVTIRWIAFLFSLVFTWFSAIWIIFTMTMEKKRDGLTKDLLLLSFYSVFFGCACLVFASGFTLWAPHNMPAMLSGVMLFTGFATAILWYFTTTAVKCWQGAKAP